MIPGPEDPAQSYERPCFVQLLDLCSASGIHPGCSLCWLDYLKFAAALGEHPVGGEDKPLHPGSQRSQEIKGFAQQAWWPEIDPWNLRKHARTHARTQFGKEALSFHVKGMLPFFSFYTLSLGKAGWRVPFLPPTAEFSNRYCIFFH